jgi:transposase InsO family protein
MSLGRNRYFITFIDDFNRKLWIYFLEEKSAAFTVFKNFKALVENQSGHKLVTLHSDQGEEFTSKEFDKYCREHGIKHQLTAAYTLQQNGIAERKNRIILNMIRTMLKEKGLPKQFWAKAVAFILSTQPMSCQKCQEYDTSRGMERLQAKCCTPKNLWVCCIFLGSRIQEKEA